MVPLFGTLYHPSQFDSVKATLNRNDPIMWLPQAVLVVDHQRCPLAFAVPPSVSKRRAQLEYLSSLSCFFFWVRDTPSHRLKLGTLGCNPNPGFFLHRLVLDPVVGMYSTGISELGGYQVHGGLWLRLMVSCSKYTELSFQPPPHGRGAKQPI